MQSASRYSHPPLLSQPWPELDCRGRLEPPEEEWLHTNELGSYAMSTVAMMHTRRYHGALVAALAAPIRRHVILSHIELSVRVAGRTYRLATHQFPGVAPTPGYRLLRKFAQDPIPRWVYSLGRGELEVKMSLARAANCVVFQYRWDGSVPISATARPLMPLRSTHSLTTEHGGMMQVAVLRAGEVEIQPVTELPSVFFRHSGVFVGSPDWWRQLEYLEDRTRAAAYREDLWTPGTFELELEPGAPTWLTVSVGSPPEGSPEALQEQTEQALRAADPGPAFSVPVRVLSIAAKSYSAVAAPRPAILAGFPWYDVHTRDVLVALPGIHLARGEQSEARAIVASLVAEQRVGLLPQILGGDRANRARRSVDATLWLMATVAEMLRQGGGEETWLRTVASPALTRAFVRIASGKRRYGYRTPDGLIACSEEGAPHTWFDSGYKGVPTVPRVGLPVEWQALWVTGCRGVAEVAERCGHTTVARAAVVAADRAKRAFQERFWCRDLGYGYDCISEAAVGAGSWQDRSIRPNVVVALALAPELFEDWQARSILDRAALELVTPHGLRTLSPADARYQGYHEGGLEEREGSAHQGTCWPYLLGFFARASRRLSPDDPHLNEGLRHLLEKALVGPTILGHVSQMADGDAPHRSRGCPAQAWSVAELLRALREAPGSS